MIDFIRCTKEKKYFYYSKKNQKNNFFIIYITYHVWVRYLHLYPTFLVVKLALHHI